jgi:hypothetical protein
MASSYYIGLHPLRLPIEIASRLLCRVATLEVARREVRIIVRLWTKFTIIGVLLILSLSGTVYAARATLGAVHSFTVQQTLSKSGDVRTIRPWMTINYIGSLCRVPTDYLDDSLGIPPSDKPLNRATLHELATHFKQSDTEAVYIVQKAILNYRHHEPPVRLEFTPTSTPTPTSKKVAVKPAFTPTPTPKSKKTAVRPKPTPASKGKKTTGRKAQKA